MTEVAASNAHVEHYLQLSSEERVKSERVRPSLDALVAGQSIRSRWRHLGLACTL